MDLDLLRSFVVTAEEENVGRAAQRLHVTQSPLSRQIQRLEAELGFLLFHRIRKRLRLTAEGRLFLDHARALLAHAESVSRTARQLARGEDVPLEVGYVQAALYGGLLSAALRRLGRGGVRLHPLRSAQQAEGVASGALDLGLVHSLPDDPLISSHRLAEERFVLAVPADDPLAIGDVAPSALDGTPWIALDKSRNPRFRAAFLDACRSLGFSPDIQYETADVPTALGLVAAGLGKALVHEAVTRWGVPDGVSLRALPDFPMRVTTHAVWRGDTVSPRLERLLSALGIPLP